jgi:two-component system NtrC family sensor kinase
MWMLVLAVAVALVAWLAILLWSGWVRPLRRLRDQVLALSRGEWNRLLLSEPLPGELWTVLLRLEGLRRALLDRLRSSTELNLQLEGEVARRSAELSRRNAELKQAVASLQQARDELVRRERLAAVGSVVASLTSEINNPVSSMVALVAPLKDAHAELSDCLLAHCLGPAASARRSSARTQATR